MLNCIKDYWNGLKLVWEQRKYAKIVNKSIKDGKFWNVWRGKNHMPSDSIELRPNGMFSEVASGEIVVGDPSKLITELKCYPRKKKGRYMTEEELKKAKLPKAKLPKKSKHNEI